MMKNRAGLLALLVLVAATLLMVFFVLPRIGNDKKPIGDAVNQASSAVKNTLADSTQKAPDVLPKTGEATQNSAAANTETAQKLGSLTGAATASLTELKALFADGKGPTADVFGSAKTKVISALQAIVDFALPQGADPATTAMVDRAHDGAGKALSIIQALPENITDGLGAIQKAEAALIGQPGAETVAGPVTPAFDVLRVEPDGSTVIAGSAQPGAKLEILDGDKVVTTTEVGPSGDFAAVLDNPLPPGDHELVLKATGKDGKSVVSEEVATVSVPKDDSTQLLAMVSKPGKASRIITAPTAKQPRVASATGEAAPASTDGTAGAQDTTLAVASPTTNPAAAVATDDHPEIMVNAVEIENDHIFVAGTTRPRAKVRAYADDKLIGEIVAAGDGHFVIDGTMPLSVGDHNIRVDVLDASGKAVLRTAVNFNRPAGNQVTVAAQTQAAAPAASSAAAMVPLDEGQLGKLRDDIAKAFSLLKGLFTGGKVPGDEQLAAARSGTEIALKSLSEFRPAIDANATLKQSATTASASAAKALAFLQALPKDAKSVGDAIDRIELMLASIIKPVAAVPVQASADATPNSGEPKTFQQAPLAANSNAVIIRHGDTLWQISRRTYGLGVRYTTIYLANEDKINNPDHILPGQVFGLPKDALPNAEELHRKRPWQQHTQ
ncbi:LysM peptidoglycan-binding domain-containing protein [Rhizobium tubonense]|uniref:Peptidoglycan-binding protein LysM n=1 Tax=Rhizobium tubonense TaxID=484088 RepID=A0A2W4D1Q0_9HYPH|nr:LysM peptidoglycan-binding domain-containing protein [Rhizobium tubonense]PZM17301.1 peptidoglycan-binding protein LysM [Rhizobium tubonense]